MSSANKVNEFGAGIRRATEGFGTKDDGDLTRITKSNVGFTLGQYNPQLNPQGLMPFIHFGLNTTGISPTAAPMNAPKGAMAAAAATVQRPLSPFIVRLPGPNDIVFLKNLGSLAADRAEHEMVLHVLEQTNGNRSRAARRLSISYRALLNKLKKWRMDQTQAS